MLERVITYIERHLLLPRRGSIVVAVSGGADSLCLLHLFRRICGPGGRYPDLSLQAAHLNHMLRGQESVHDAQMVADMLASWQVPCIVGEVDVIALARAERRSLEDAARLARYRFLREVAQGRRIAVAHHADDQVETLLLHWLRGSGLSGLTGMPPRQQDIIRPLLEITHAETLAYCQEHGLTPVEDHSNNDPRFLRNRLRHEVLPLLHELNPGIQHTLLRNAEVISVDLAWLESQVDACWPRIVVSEQEESIQLHIPALLTLPLSLQRHLLRRVTARLCEGQSPLEPRHFLLIEQVLTKQIDRARRELHLPHGLRVIYQANDLIFLRALTKQPTPFTGEKIILPIPGEVLIPGMPWLAQAEIVPEELGAMVKLALHQANWPEIWRLLGPATPQTVFIDGSSAGRHLLVRGRRTGDRIQPLGMTLEKKVQDIFVDKHIPQSERDTVPLFFSETDCLWVAGLCLSHRVRLTSQTECIVRLSIRQVTIH